MLGQDLCPILKNANYTVIETDIDTLDITKLDAKSILSDEVLTEIFEEQNPIEQAKLLLSVQEKAKILTI